MALMQIAQEQQGNSVSPSRMPEIGRAEADYVAQVQAADAAGDKLAHAAAKVGQYVTIALEPRMPWEETARCFQHTFKHHCAAPPAANPQDRQDYAKLADLVRDYAGHVALRLGRAENERLKLQLAAKVQRSEVRREAVAFFSRFSTVNGQCPDWMNREAWMELMELRATWS